MIHNAIVSVLKANLSVTALVADRITPNVVLQGNKYPSIGVDYIENEPMQGSVGICIRSFLVLLHIVSESKLVCENVKEVLISQFNKTKHQFEGNSFSMQYVGMPLNEFEKDAKLFHTGIEFQIFSDII